MSAPQDQAISVSKVKSGFALALLANVLWGTSFLASKYTLQSWGPLTASALRFAIALIAMAVVLPIAGKKIRPPRSLAEFGWVAAVGLTGFGFLYPLQLQGLTSISSGLSAAIMLTSPLFVVCLGAFFLKERISSRKIAAILFGILGGCLLLSSKGNESLGENAAKGAVLTVFASLSLALSVVVTRKASQHFDSANLTFWSMLAGLIVLVPFAARESLHGGFQMPNLNSVFALLYLAVVCSAVCFFIWNLAIARSSPRELATTMHVKTPTAVFLGVVFANESLSMLMLLGMFAVGGGVWLSQSETRKEKV